MTQLFEFLANKLPEQDQSCLSFSDHQPKAFNTWVDSLPMVNTGESAKLLYHATVELSHLNIAPGHRYQLLEMLRPKVHYINEELKSHYTKHPIILSPKAKKVASLCQSLQKNLAVNYKICLIDALMSKSKILSSAREYIPSSMHRFMTELCFALLRSYQLYLPPMPNVWLELHLTYALAEEKGLLDFSMDDDIVDNRIEHTISAIYKKAIILASSQPNQLEAEDLENIFYSSNRWQNLVNITAESLPKSLYALILNNDVPPHYIRDLKDQHHFLRFVSMDNLMRHLQNYPDKPVGPKDRTAEPLASERCFVNELLTKHLVNTWGQANKRNKERLPNTSAVQAVLGYADCLEQLRSLSGAQTQEKTAETSEKETQDIELGAANAFTSFKSETDSNNAAQTPHPCKMVNLSLGGACLAWFNNVPKTLSNGNLIYLKADDSPQWRLGVIRWTRHFQGEGIRTGIKFLPTQCQVVSFKYVKAKDPHTKHDCILMPPVNMGEPPSLIIHAQTPATQTTATLFYNGEHDIKIGALNYQNANFKEVEVISEDKLFETNMMAIEVNKESVNKNSLPTDEDDLGNLWAEL